MRTILKGIGKLFCALVSVLLVAVLVVGGWFGIQGYNMYQDAIEDMPISEKVETIRAMDNFVEYDELPEIYIDAVISVEDKRFEEHHGVDYLAICRAAWMQTAGKGCPTLVKKELSSGRVPESETTAKAFI